MWHVWGRWVHTWLLCGDIQETNDLEDLDVSGRIILKWVFKKYDGGVWSGLIWLRIGIGGGLYGLD